MKKSNLIHIQKGQFSNINTQNRQINYTDNFS